jgi:hypothetical protein
MRTEICFWTGEVFRSSMFKKGEGSVISGSLWSLIAGVSTSLLCVVPPAARGLALAHAPIQYTAPDVSR